MFSVAVCCLMFGCALRAVCRPLFVVCACRLLLVVFCVSFIACYWWFAALLLVGVCSLLSVNVWCRLWFVIAR